MLQTNNRYFYTPILVPIEPEAPFYKKLLIKGGMLLDQWMYLGNRRVRLLPLQNPPGHFHIQEESSSRFITLKIVPFAILIFATRHFKVNPAVLLLPLAGKVIYKLSYAMPFVRTVEASIQKRKEEAKQKVADLKQSFEAIKGKPNYEDEAIQLIRRNYQDDCALEIERLKMLGVLNAENEQVIDKTIASIPLYTYILVDKRKIHLKVLLAQALEIKTLFSKTYHIFTHGQSTSWLIVSLFVKKMLQKRIFTDLDNPQNAALALSLKHFKYLRNFSEQTSLEPTPGLPQHVLEFLNQFPTFAPHFDHDPSVRNHLISVDAHMYNVRLAESALYFLASNVNVYQYSNHNIVKSTIAKIISSFKSTLSPEVIEKYAKELVEAVPKTPMPCGNLFVICVPKELSESIQYRSHPFGIPCNCDTSVEKANILEDLQQNKMPKSFCTQQPQYRLYTPLLRPEYGVRIFRLIPMPRDQKNALKVQVSAIVDRLHQEK